jgi:hypothetical protein
MVRWGNLRERDPLEDLDVDRRIIFTWISKTGLFWLRVAGCCKCGNEPSASVKCWEHLD